MFTNHPPLKHYLEGKKIKIYILFYFKHHKKLTKHENTLENM